MDFSWVPSHLLSTPSAPKLWFLAVPWMWLLCLMCRSMRIHEEVGLTLTFFCPLQNTWNDSIAPKTLQPKTTTSNNITVLLTTSVRAELVAPVLHDGDCGPTMVFPGNTSIWSRHWMYLGSEGSSHTGATRGSLGNHHVDVLEQWSGRKGRVLS